MMAYISLEIQNSGDSVNTPEIPNIAHIGLSNVEWVYKDRG